MKTFPTLTFLPRQAYTRRLRHCLAAYLILLAIPLVTAWTSPEWAVANFFEITIFLLLLFVMCVSHFCEQLDLSRDEIMTLSNSLKELDSPAVTEQFQEAIRQQRIITNRHLRMVTRALDPVKEERARQNILQVQHSPKAD